MPLGFGDIQSLVSPMPSLARYQSRGDALSLLDSQRRKQAQEADLAERARQADMMNRQRQAEEAGQMQRHGVTDERERLRLSQEQMNADRKRDDASVADRDALLKSALESLVQQDPSSRRVRLELLRRHAGIGSVEFDEEGEPELPAPPGAVPPPAATPGPAAPATPPAPAPQTPPVREEPVPGDPLQQELARRLGPGGSAPTAPPGPPPVSPAAAPAADDTELTEEEKRIAAGPDTPGGETFGGNQEDFQGAFGDKQQFGTISDLVAPFKEGAALTAPQAPAAQPPKAEPAKPKRSGKLRVKDKGGKVLFEGDAGTIRGEQDSEITRTFASLPNKAAAQAAAEYARGRIGTDSREKVLQDATALYKHIDSQEGKDRRVGVGGPLPPSLAERRFAAGLDDDDFNKAMKLIGNEERQSSLQKQRFMMNQARSVANLAARGSGYGDQAALKSQIAAIETRVTDADMRIAMDSGGLTARITRIKNWVLREGQFDPEFMKEVQSVALQMQSLVLQNLRTAGEEAYSSAMTAPGIREDRRAAIAGFVYGTVTGDFSRAPKRAQAGGDGAAPEQRPGAPY